MFRGYWLVADVDGTLTPTPTKAGGRYLSLSQSAHVFGSHYLSCLPTLRHFIKSGGSLCAVSTAGRRLWAQLYDDLAPALFPPLSELTGSRAFHTIRGPGRLLICGFSGAALFRSRDPATAYAAMHERANNTTLHEAHDARSDTGLPPASLGMEEWTSYRDEAIAVQATYNKQHSSFTTTATSSSTAIGAHERGAARSKMPESKPVCTTLDEPTRAAAAAEGRAALVRFLEHASYVSGHNVERAEAFFRTCLSRKYHRVYAELLRAILQDLTQEQEESHECHVRIDPQTHVCFEEAAPLRMEHLAQHGYYLRETNDALVDSQVVPQADGTVTEQGNRDAVTAQIVVMGIPAAYFTAVFPRTKTSITISDNNYNSSSGVTCECCPRCAQRAVGAVERLEALGLELKSQPNSVCLHRRGVDKATCLAWLCAHERELNFSLSQALAIADTPSSVDRPLLHFAPMRFISVSPKAPQTRTSGDSNGGEGFTQEEMANMCYVGGEEEGTECFLDMLLRHCTHQCDNDETMEMARLLFNEKSVRFYAEEARAKLAQHLTHM